MHALPTFLHSSSSLVNEERILDTAMRQVKRKKLKPTVGRSEQTVNMSGKKPAAKKSQPKEGNVQF